ncbi:unnamed protein product [Rotaria socialis]|uniref:Uncharacterized protein n=1 Tax=Rotaria socialis TaxID=392032 RepID=A0A821WMK8_9BILA|nr:unnamed protein product [Rotaria socialis]CAF4927459.1 unnamed protein product [Rotaria socialis]
MASEASSSTNTNQSKISSSTPITKSTTSPHAASNSRITKMNETNCVLVRRLPKINATSQKYCSIYHNIYRCCVDLISNIEDEKVFLIVTDSLGGHRISDIEIHTWTQLNSIYVLNDRPITYEQWARVTSKVKGVYTQVDSICETLKVHLGQYDQVAISMSFNGFDPLFMYTQLFTEALLEIEDDDDKSIKELTECCRRQGDIHKDDINKVEREYHQHRPIWWYTTPYLQSQ